MVHLSVWVFFANNLEEDESKSMKAVATTKEPEYDTMVRKYADEEVRLILNYIDERSWNGK